MAHLRRRPSMSGSMRRTFVYSALCVSACLTAACYESAFPIDTLPQSDLAAGLAGAWHCVTSDAGDRDMTLTIARTSNRLYAVTLQEYGHESDRYEAHASLV